MYKSFSGAAFVLVAWGVGCSQANGDKATNDAKQPINFGDTVSASVARQGPWVTIEAAAQKPGWVDFGSGILLAPDIVLTAAHVVDGIKTFDVTVTRGNTGATGANKPQKIRAQTIAVHRSYHQFMEVWTVSPDGTFSFEDAAKLTPAQREAKIKDPNALSWRLGVDLAVIRLKEPFAMDPVGLAAPYCDLDEDFLPEEFDVVSGGPLRSGFTNVGVKNSARFQVHNPKFTKLSLSPFAGSVDYLHLDGNDITPAGMTKKRFQFIVGGDSGSGVLLPTTPKDNPNIRQVVGVISTANDPPGSVAAAIVLAPQCQWLETVKNRLHSDAAFDVREEIPIDDTENKQLKGTLQRFIASLSSDGVEVEIGAGDKVATYRLTLPTPPSEIRASEIGTFSSRGAGLVFLDDGRIVARNVFDDSALSIDVPSEAEYKDLLVVNTTSPTQPYNDLVAIKPGNLGADLYRGGANGFTRAGVEGLAITSVDDDAAADVVILDGTSLKVATPNSVHSTTLPFSPRESTSGNFTRNGATSGRDLAFLGSNGQVAFCAMTSEATFVGGGCTNLSLPGGLEANGIRGTYFDSDAFEDLEVSFENGQVAIFKGGASGLSFDTFAQGMPSARTDDGKLELVSGTQADTLGAPMSEFYVAEPVDSSGSPTAKPLVVQIYDPGIWGSFDGVSEDTPVSTCLNVYASPVPGASTEVLVKSVGETEFGPGELGWYTLFDSSVDGHSPGALSSNGVHWYRVEVKLVNVDDECDAPPIVEHAAFNGYKLRTSGQVRSPNGHVLYGSDAFGAFASFESAPDTRFDGTFDVPFYVGSAVERPEVPGAAPVGITLRQADADDADQGGDADGQRDDIYFKLFRGTAADGVALQVKRTEGQITDDLNVPTTTVENPSGNASGSTAIFEKHTTEGLETIQPGLHTWHWANVGAENAIQLQPVTGSPINHEFIAPGGLWISSSAAQGPVGLLALTDEELESLLPLDLGDAGFGQLRTFSSSAAVREGLSEVAADDSAARLAREALALKLNVLRARRSGEPMEAAFVLSTRVAVGELLQKVDTLLGGGQVDLTVEEALRLMQVANLGELTYLSPRELVLASDDRDADGIADAADNCVMRANADQVDSNGDGIGDRCEPTPTVWCVEPRSKGGMTAVFGYESPLRDFRIPEGTSNEFVGHGVVQAPPVLFRRGVQRQAVTVPFEGNSVTWTVFGKSATATADAPRCSDVGAGAAVCEASTSEFYCCTSIAGCKAAGRFGLYAQDSLRMAQRVRVLDESGRPGSILSLGSIVMEAEAEAGDVAGGGELVVGNRVGLFGDIAVSGALTQLGSQLSLRPRQVPLDAPDLSAFSRPFLRAATRAVDVGSGRVRGLEPGAYGAARVAGDVTLVAGDYYFTSLDLLEGASLRIDGSNGPVMVHVASSISLRGGVVAEPGELLLELYGPGDVRVGTDLAATIIAPDGRVVVDQPGSVQIGAIYARSIELTSDVTHLYHRPLAPRL